ncbi:HEAT repeat domain-containing protein [Flavobacterium granuli]|uniref:HEAT repeat-containing protein n=1 Tax=Flavobacterium granuli TaxID=280093 RepID=A0A1M5I953_9FLAO|nr:hypothetical protein [Flavobacterium granuli]PRZ27863.1 hypothetical protein BC624_101144 [Flavobacterium granuli]SHG24928.1 hypothetical protein SAMN05443373_101144 [Flavobacterium granuli]
MVNLYQNIVDYLKNAPEVIQFLWALITTLILIICSLILYLKHSRSRLRIKERIQKVYQKKYESDLIEYLYAGNEDNEISVEQQQIVNYFKKCSTNRLKRKLIITTLLKLRNEISGETADAIQKLYYQTEMMNSAAAKLKHKKWNVVARAINELTQFEIKEVHDQIIQLINHPKREVRKEIQMYLVKLFHFEGLDFLNILTTPLSEWDQIQLLEILQKFDDQEIPDITNWLNSSNDSVAFFALKLAKIYNQFEAKDAIISLLYHPEKEMRIEAIGVLSHMGAIEAVAILKNNFDQLSLDEQIAFFKMMENMHEAHDEEFIIPFMNHVNFDIRVSAMKIVKAIEIKKPNAFKIIPSEKKYPENTALIKAS